MLRRRHLIEAHVENFETITIVKKETSEIDDLWQETKIKIIEVNY